MSQVRKEQLRFNGMPSQNLKPREQHGWLTPKPWRYSRDQEAQGFKGETKNIAGPRGRSKAWWDEGL